jgi:hypothetical protein
MTGVLERTTLSPAEYLRFEWRTVLSIYELVNTGFLGTRLLSPHFSVSTEFWTQGCFPRIFVSFSYTCVGNMGCTPSLCYDDVVRGVINSRGILQNIALYNGVCAEARTF